MKIWMISVLLSCAAVVAHAAPNDASYEDMDTLLAEASTALERVTAADFPAEWKAIARVLDVATERLGCAWGAVGHLNAVADTPELRAAYNAALPKVTEFWTRLGADERLYAKYKAMDPARLTPEQAQAHKNAMRGFVLGGAELQGTAKERFAAIQERQAELGQKFSENALDATDAWTYYASAEELGYSDDDLLEAMDCTEVRFRVLDAFVGLKRDQHRTAANEQRLRHPRQRFRLAVAVTVIVIGRAQGIAHRQQVEERGHAVEHRVGQAGQQADRAAEPPGNRFSQCQNERSRQRGKDRLPGRPLPATRHSA